jgi:hypothetical protein
VTCVFHGERFEFLDGKSLTFADWEVILQVAEDVCGMLNRVVTTAVLEGHATHIPAV